MAPWRWGLGIGALAILLLATSAPVLMGEVPALGIAIYGGLSSICHQDPSRGFIVAGIPGALCARCLGVWAGAALALLAPLRLSTPQLIGLFVAAVVAWTLEALTPGWPAEARLIAGAPIGLALAAPLAEASRRTVLC